MKQFASPPIIESFQFATKEKIKSMCIDYFEQYILVIDTQNRLHVYVLCSLTQLYVFELKDQEEFQLTIGCKSQILAAYHSSQIYNFNIQNDKKLQNYKKEGVLQYEIHPHIDDYFLLTDTYIQMKDVLVQIIDPIYMKPVFASSFNLILLTKSKLSINKDLNELDCVYIDLSNRQVKLKYDEQHKTIAIIDKNKITIMKIVNQKIVIIYLQQEQKVERILDACFFTFPYHKYDDKINYLIFFASGRNKSGQQLHIIENNNTLFHNKSQIEDKKCKQLIPVFCWGNHILGLFEQGYMYRICLYKNNQFEKLEYKFTYIHFNQVYKETEDEFDRKPKKEQQILDPAMFQKSLYDPYDYL